MTKANKNETAPKACSERCARDYQANATEVRRLLARLNDAAEQNFDATFGHVRGAEIDFSHVGSLGVIKHALREFSDRVFSEGEYRD